MDFGLNLIGIILGFLILKLSSKSSLKILGHPDEIRATKISSRWNKGNKDSIGQVGQADPPDSLAPVCHARRERARCTQIRKKYL